MIQAFAAQTKAARCRPLPRTTLLGTAQTLAVFQECLADSAPQVVTAMTVESAGFFGVPRRMVPTLGSGTCLLYVSTEIRTTVRGPVFQFVAFEIKNAGLWGT